MNRYWDSGFDDMMNLGSNMGMWFIIYNIVRLLIIVGVVIFIARIMFKYFKDNRSSNGAVEILRERYAKGEIDDEEYRVKLDRLKED